MHPQPTNGQKLPKLTHNLSDDPNRTTTADAIYSIYFLWRFQRMMASLEQVQIINIAANCFWSVDVISLTNVTMMLHTCFSVLRLEEAGGSEKCQRICLNLNQSVNICENRSQLSIQTKKASPQGTAESKGWTDLLILWPDHNWSAQHQIKVLCKGRL